MEPFTLPVIFVAIGTIFGGVIIGFFYFLGIFGKARKGMTKEAEDANIYTIKSLKEKIEILEEKFTLQELLLKNMAREVEILKNENRTLQELVVVALESYFKDNPRIAANISDKIK